MILWNLFEIAINAFQSWLLIYFLHSKLRFSGKERKYKWLYLISATTFLSTYLFFDFPLAEGCLFLFALAYAIAASDDHWLLCVFWTAVLAILFMTTLNLIVDLYMSWGGLTYEGILVPGWRRALYMLCSNVFLFVFVRVASRIKFGSVQMNWPSMLVFLIILAGMMLLSELVFLLQSQVSALVETRLFFYIYLGTAVSTLATLLLFHLLTQSAKREAAYRSEVSTLTMTRKHQQELEQLHAELRMKLHDFRHHMQTMETLVNTSGSEEAQHYLQTYREGTMDRDVFLTGCTGVDAILTAKCLTMKSLGIRFEYNGYPLNELPVPQPDFCAMLGNVLDNAIESVARMEVDPSEPIKLTFSRSWDMFYVFCQNPCDPQTLKRHKGRWMTSKADADLHGLGTENIRSVAERSGGRCTFECRENTFLTKIVLPYGRDVKCRENASK